MFPLSLLPRDRFASLAFLSFSVLSFGVVSPAAIAQIQPDTTLGNETSMIQFDVLIRGALGDRVEGGAIRGANLFHSFSQFNVEAGQRVYFANPTGIQTILTRVTGSNSSNILGTLGVDGSANLFLINPNGILFGPNARLDISGSFVASGGTRFQFVDGSEFSATNPQSPPLLTINLTPGLQLGNAVGNVTNQGNLQVGGDLTLVGNQLALEGQLQAGGNLNLLAANTLQVRDRLDSPFLAQSGGHLLIQGNQAIDIFALNNPASGVWAGQDLVLRSANPAIADAHFYSGGSFRVEQLDGSLGSWLSPNDPVIRASGDVSFTTYTGNSLHIFAGGSVTADSITLNGADPANGISEIVTLSDGSALSIQGQTQPTVDIRAGTTAVGTPLGVTGAPAPTNLQTPATGGRGDIAIASITATQPNSLIFLTNQYNSTGTPGDITVGAITTGDPGGSGKVVIDSRGGIILNDVIDTSDFSFNSNGGDVTLLAGGDILINAGAAIQSIGDLGGNITLKSKGDVTIIGVDDSTLCTDGIFCSVESTSFSFATDVKGGDILISGRTVNLRNEASVLAGTFDAIGGNLTIRATEAIRFNSGIADTATFGFGQGGNILVEAPLLSLDSTDQPNTVSEILAVTIFGASGAAGNVTINAADILLNTADDARSGTQVGSFSRFSSGNAGNLTITGQTLAATNGSQIIATTFASGNSGQITLNLTESIALDGVRSNGAFSTINSAVQSGATGKGGEISITTGLLSLTNGAQIRTATQGPQGAGNIAIDADEVIVDGVGINNFPSAIVSTVLVGGEGNGGNITLKADNATFSNGGLISANTNSNTLNDTQGRAGQVTLEIDNNLTFDGTGAGLPSGVLAEAFRQGEGGVIDISAATLTLANGAQLRSTTDGIGKAGDIEVDVTESIQISGSNSGFFADSSANSTGNSGLITVVAPTIELENTARISVDSQGVGTGGNIQIETNALTLRDRSGISAETQSNTGGNIQIDADAYVLLRSGSFVSTTAGKAQSFGDGGNITITTGFVVAALEENSDVTANAFQGQGGRVDITAQGIFGILPQVSLTEFSDITASSEFGLNGVIIINTPDIDPSRGLVKLPADTVDASKLVAEGCSANGAIAETERQNNFVVTGRGGLPPGPGDASSTATTTWEDLRSLPTSTAQQAQQSLIAQPVQPAIVEAQTWVKNRAGQIQLIASSAKEYGGNLPKQCQEQASIPRRQPTDF